MKSIGLIEVSGVTAAIDCLDIIDTPFLFNVFKISNESNEEW